MNRILVLASLLLAVAIPLSAAVEYEQILLTVGPSRVYCDYNAVYETRLIVFHDGPGMIDRVCSDTMCGSLGPREATEISGPVTVAPLPMFLYVPKAQAKDLALMLEVESSDKDKPETRAFTELPIVRAEDFRAGKVQIIGIRVDPGFRQGMRIYALDGHNIADVVMRVYSMKTGELLNEETYRLWPAGPWYNDAGFMAAPSFTMECNLSEHPELIGQQVRIELEPVTPDTKIWAFMSVANNVTQQFYTIMPR